MVSRVAVLGAGSWGTTAAGICARNVPTTVWVREEEADVATEINTQHTNSAYLPPEARLPADLSATTDAGAALRDAGLVVVAIPSRWLRATVRGVAPHLPAGVPLLSLVKGLEADTNLRMTQVIADETENHPIGALSGPNIAREIALGIMSASVLAFEDVDLARELSPLFTTARFRVYVNHDVLGVETGGALKNVVALATGMSDGAGGGDNTRAAIITRGLAELTRLGVAMGAEPQTFAGLAGVGDLIATCTSTHSRNHTVGVGLAHGRALDEILGEMTQVAEGVTTAPVVLELASAHGVDVPICAGINAVLEGEVTPIEMLKAIAADVAGHELEPG